MDSDYLNKVVVYGEILLLKILLRELYSMGWVIDVTIEEVMNYADIISKNRGELIISFSPRIRRMHLTWSNDVNYSFAVPYSIYSIEEKDQFLNKVKSWENG